ncbi:MAG: DNA-processing protein DprA [Pseudomonadota bacterium]
MSRTQSAAALRQDSVPLELGSSTVLTESERIARLRLLRSHNVGPRTYSHLIRRFSSASRALEVLPDLAARGGKSGYKICPLDEIESELEAGEAFGARMVQIDDPQYPQMLAQIEPPPPILWMKGNAELLEDQTVALVGSRNASALGVRTARRLARELGATGYTVVSGLARGIDAAAHEASLSTGTVAVLAGALDKPYPTENIELCKRIAEDGLLISEIPFGIEPTGKHFPRRNRIISGLSHGVVVVEAASKSGSLITARFALEQGREAMACPGAPEDPRASGCNALIREGAALIRHAGDVEEALSAPRSMMLMEDGGEFDFDADSFGDESLRDEYDALADFDEEGGGHGDEALAEQVLDLLGPQAIEIDEVARQCGASPQEISLAILELDLAGSIEILPGGMIARIEM